MTSSILTVVRIVRFLFITLFFNSKFNLNILYSKNDGCAWCRCFTFHSLILITAACSAGIATIFPSAATHYPLRFVNHRLVNCPAALKHVLLQFLFEMESFSCLKHFLIEQYQQVFYSNANPILYIPPRDIDLLLRSLLELLHLEFYQPVLSQLLMSLCTEGPQSRFYLDVLESDLFSVLWQRQQRELAPRV